MGATLQCYQLQHFSVLCWAFSLFCCAQGHFDGLGSAALYEEVVQELGALFVLGFLSLSLSPQSSHLPARKRALG